MSRITKSKYLSTFIQVLWHTIIVSAAGGLRQEKQTQVQDQPGLRCETLSHNQNKRKKHEL